MDTLSALFSKNFKKDPAPPQFHGINEDLYEGKKLISKRRRTKNKIAKKSSLVEGFANELDDVTATEDVQTAQLNAELQKNLSSYATSLKTVVSDYVTARAEQKACVASCNNLAAVSTIGADGCPHNWYFDKGSGKCVQICPSNKQSRDAD